MTFLWIYFTLQFVFLVKDPVLGKDATSFVKEFNECNGRDTGLKRVQSDHLDLYGNCLLELGSNRYCQIRCSFKAFKTLDDNNKPDMTKIDQFVDEFDRFPEREALRNASKVCATYKKTYPTDNGCKNVRAWYYCFYNEFERYCNKGKHYKNVNVPSQEEGIDLEDAGGLVGTIGL